MECRDGIVRWSIRSDLKRRLWELDPIIPLVAGAGAFCSHPTRFLPVQWCWATNEGPAKATLPPIFGPQPATPLQNPNPPLPTSCALTNSESHWLPRFIPHLDASSARPLQKLSVILIACRSIGNPTGRAWDLF